MNFCQRAMPPPRIIYGLLIEINLIFLSWRIPFPVACGGGDSADYERQFQRGFLLSDRTKIAFSSRQKMTFAPPSKTKFVPLVNRTKSTKKSHILPASRRKKMSHHMHQGCGRKGHINQSIRENGRGTKFYGQAPKRLKNGVSVCKNWNFWKAPNEYLNRCQTGESGKNRTLSTFFLFIQF